MTGGGNGSPDGGAGPNLSRCDNEPGFLVNENGDCVKEICEPGKVKNADGECVCGEGMVEDVTGRCLSEADFWEEEKIDDTQIDSCISTVLNNLKELEKGPGQVVANIFGTFDSNINGFNWTIKNGIPNNPDAAAGTYTYDRLKNEVVTVFDMGKFSEASDLSVARTLIHEAIHANLNAYFANDPSAATKMYSEMMDDFIGGMTNTNDLHHQQMLSFIGFISEALKEYGNSIMGYNLSDSFYDKLAWGGLTDTRTFKSFSTSVKNNIQNTIKIEQSGKDIYDNTQTQKGNDAGC